MGLIQQATDKLASLASNGGTVGSIIRSGEQLALSLALPNDIEAFSLTLQLMLGGDREARIQSFTFPVMPESLLMAQKYLMTVTTTLGGNYVDDFGRAPNVVSLSGTFGRKIRSSGIAGNLRSIGGAVDFAESAGSGVSTGYGMVKRLSTMVEDSHTVQSDGKLPRLMLYNWAFNSHWEVVVDNLDVKMDVSQNGIWMYKLDVRTLQPVSDMMARADAMINGAAQSLLNGKLHATVQQLVLGAAVTKAVTSGKVSSALSKLKG